MLPRDSWALMAHSRPAFIPALFRQFGIRYTAGFRLLHYAPELSQATESNAGLLLILHLFLLTADGMMPDGVAVPVSVSALSRQLRVARAHIRILLANAEAAGLVRRVDEGTTVIVLPRLNIAVRNFCAALFGLLLHCATAAAEEVGSIISSGPER
jgi:hypothetical protein